MSVLLWRCGDEEKLNMPFIFYDEGDIFIIILWGILGVGAILFNLYNKYWWYKNRDEMKDFVSTLEEE